MYLIADLHLHSKYSRATSQNLNLLEIAFWSQKKGIDIVSTSDFTHPLWFREISSFLKETSDGIYSLNENLSAPLLPFQRKTKFILTTEVSNIYFHNGKTRKIHSIIFSPNLQTCEKIISSLHLRGAKLASDGRPIVGISAHDLLELLLEINQNILLIPAHIWTPHFSVFGSESGYDSLEECFGKLKNNIAAIETGLSSDPLMNWGVKDIENLSIVSFSDAHSGQKLGREATVFAYVSKKEFTYQDIVDALRQKQNSKLKIDYTIEFFPEEGKYHWSGHRYCGVKLSPQEVEEKGNLCPKCGKRITIGVENRVRLLSNRLYYDKKNIKKITNKYGLVFIQDKEGTKKPFISLIPLAEILEKTEQSQKKASILYDILTTNLATEFDILTKIPIDLIAKYAGENVAYAIDLMRKRNVDIDPGFDGVFGKVTIPKKAYEKNNIQEQQSLF